MHSLDAEGFGTLVQRTPVSVLGERLAAEPPAARLSLPRPRSPFERAEIVNDLPVPAEDELLAARTREVLAELFSHLLADERADLFNRLSESARQRVPPALALAEREDVPSSRPLRRARRVA
ncbi:MAG: hypothetical protein KatS3mg125_0511 [Lysobacterales bacterium]|jgi:Mg/Co/Ni transporter MgtE|nr:MAG: hypothetical protein KatS3mg125_0511 [Xanthomonadales bacterium]